MGDLPLIKLTSSQAMQAWNLIEPLLQKAVDFSQQEVLVCDIREEAEEGLTEVWVLVNDKIDFVFTTKVLNYPYSKVCEIQHAGSDSNMFDKEDFKTMIEQVEDWAVENNCNAISIHGRKGWAKMLPDYETPYQIYSKRLD